MLFCLSDFVYVSIVLNMAEGAGKIGLENLRLHTFLEVQNEILITVITATVFFNK